MRVQGAFARILEADRETWNARFALARREHRKLEGQVVLDFLADTLAPIVEAVAAVAPEAAGRVAERLYALALPLIARDLLGPTARRPAINEGWRLLPSFPGRLAEDAERLARALTNALHHLEQGGRPDDWLLGLLALDPGCRDLAELLEAGQVLAWRAGLPQYRASALDRAATLRPAVLGQLLGVELPDEAARDALVARLRADPWADPRASAEASPRLVGRVGGFRGVGGAFLAPPRVALVDGVFLLGDGTSTFALHADRFGAVLSRSAQAFPASSPAEKGGIVQSLGRALGRPLQGWPVAGGQVAWHDDGTVGWAGRGLRLPDLAGASAVAFDGRTLAITHPLSHHVFLVG